MSILKWFLKPGALEKANAKYRERMAEIDAKSTIQEAELITRKAANKEKFDKAIAENNQKLKEAWGK